MAGQVTDQTMFRLFIHSLAKIDASIPPTEEKQFLTFESFWNLYPEFSANIPKKAVDSNLHVTIIHPSQVSFAAIIGDLSRRCTLHSVSPKANARGGQPKKHSVTLVQSNKTEVTQDSAAPTENDAVGDESKETGFVEDSKMLALSEEGARKLVESEKIERDPRLSKLVKEQNKKHHGGVIVCESCQFESADPSLFDAHHLYPLAGGVRRTSVEDLAVLCPTCHRVAHRRADDPTTPLPVDEIRKWLSPRSSG